MLKPLINFCLYNSFLSQHGLRLQTEDVKKKQTNKAKSNDSG